MPSSSSPRRDSGRVPPGHNGAVLAGGVARAMLGAAGPTPPGGAERRHDAPGPPQAAGPDLPVEEGPVVRIGHPHGEPGDAYLREVIEAVVTELDDSATVQPVPILAEPYHQAAERHLEAGRLDVAVLSQGLDAHLCSDHLTSDPVTGLQRALLVPEGNPADIGDVSDLVAEDLTLGLDSESPYRETATAAGLGLDQLALDAEPSALNDGEIDAYLADAPALRHLTETAQEHEDHEVVVPDAAPVSHTAFLLADDADDQAEEVNRILASMREDGRLAQVLEAHGVTGQEIAAGNLTAQRACAAH
jgi:hypothetical protein